jgi:hypothetical protein
MPQYLALIYGPADQQMDRPDDMAAEMNADYMAFGEAAGAAGVIVGGNALQSTDTATTVSVLGGKGGEVVTTDGPFAETKEVLGGFAIFELPDMAAALESAHQFMELHRQYAPAWEGVCEVSPMAGSMVELVRSGAGQGCQPAPA